VNLKMHQIKRTEEASAASQSSSSLRAVSAEIIALPNLFLPTTLILFLLYGLLTLVLITLVKFDFLRESTALLLGLGFAILQFIVSPWFMDLTLGSLYHMRWVDSTELPDHLRLFTEQQCERHGIKFPTFGIIDDGAPQAFTYGHHPGNARVVISRGLIESLEQEELEAVVAHEIGHVRNWDMVLMTMANLVPLLLYFLFRMLSELGKSTVGGDNDAGTVGMTAWLAAVLTYVLYVVSEFMVLAFSRARELTADRFSGNETGNPNAMASALIKIAYGLAAQESGDMAKISKSSRKKTDSPRYTLTLSGALGSLNVFDRTAAVSMVIIGANQANTNKEPTRSLDIDRVKLVIQWDLWNPWARLYELQSTHPLPAKRLNYLSHQATAMGCEPLVTFDLVKPESYWDEFLIDLLVVLLPVLGFVFGFGILMSLAPAAGYSNALLAGLALAGVGGVIKTGLKYRRAEFPELSVAALMSQVKVSPVRPVPVTLMGTIIGKGVPGLIWSEDFVIRDATGILFLDYQQPLAIWNWLFGAWSAGDYQGKEVQVRGWFRRTRMPYLQIDSLEAVDGSLPPRRCYTSHSTYWFYRFVIALSIGTTLWINFILK
jgi:Zn-dependent protease with chaperone function